MGMKPTVSDDGSIQKQIGSAYDVVKSVADNLPAILAVSTAVEDAQEVIADITEQVQLATTAANNANQVVSNITGLVNQAESAKNTAQTFRDDTQVIKNDVITIRDGVIPQINDFQTKWPTFTANYTDTLTKHSAIVTMHDDVDADRIAAENARTKAENWANQAVDVPVETGKFSAMHWSIKASGFNTLAQGFANTANTRANDANQSALDAAASVTVAAGHVTAAGTHATNAGNSATAAAGHVTTALGHANTSLGHANTASGHAGTALTHANSASGFKDQAWQFREEARGFRDQTQAIAGGNFVPTATTINGLALTNNIVLTPANINAQPVDADLTAIAALVGTSGLLRKTAADTWTLDTTTYLTSVPAQTWASITGKPTTVSGYGITDAQPLDATLTAVAGVTTSANTIVFFNGVDTAASTPLTAFGRSLIDDADATAARTTLGLGTAATSASTAFQASATQLSTLVTNINAASSGIFKKTAANTWSFAALVDTDIPNLAASKITTGTFTDALIPNLNVSKLTAGTLPVDRGGTGVATLTGLVRGNGTGAFSVAVAGTDYVIPSGSITGNAATATKLAAVVQINGINFDGSASITIPAPGSVATADALTTARAITVTGDADWTVNFKGDAPVTAALTLKDVATAGTGTKVTYNAKGLVTDSTSLAATDIPNLDWSKITTGVPSFALQSDARFTDSREWTATTALLADITGSDTTRKAYTGAVIKAAIDDIAAPRVSTNSRLTALESAPDSSATARRALALAIMGI